MAAIPILCAFMSYFFDPKRAVKVASRNPEPERS